MLAAKLTKVVGWLDLSLAPYLHVIIRILRPRVVVKTGVGPGVSTIYILFVIERNGQGGLFSIDLLGADQYIYMTKGLIRDFYRYSSEGWGPGWLVPDMLKKRWHLFLGDSRKILPRLLRDLGQIDMFLHDCLHTYDHMIFEYSIVWKHLAHEGILASDDVEWNIAFYDFCRAVKARRVVIGWRLGLAAPKNIQI